MLRYNNYNDYNSYKYYIFLAILVIIFDAVVFSTTSDLGMPGMKRLTPMLISIYFLWGLCWWVVEKGVIRGRWGIRVILGLLLLHHLIVYPANLTAIKQPSPFKVADWFDGQNPQKSVDQYVESIKKHDLTLDCRKNLKEGGQCFYDFIYPSVAGSCEWNKINCHNIYGFDTEKESFKELSIDYFSNKNQ